MVFFSFSNSITTSPLDTWVPSGTFHWAMVPSTMVSPARGMGISTTPSAGTAAGAGAAGAAAGAAAAPPDREASSSWLSARMPMGSPTGTVSPTWARMWT